jgi:hypothetical protein
MFQRTYAPASLERSSLLHDRYLIAAEGDYRVYYAPFGSWPDDKTRLLLVGLTPGFAQVQLAAEAFLGAEPRVREDPVAFAALLRSRVAFGGSMRMFLCEMLDDIDLPRHLNIRSSADLFSSDCCALGTTSALVYPVLKGLDRRNFAGISSLGRISLFRTMLEELLQPRLEAAPNALIVPLGKAATSGLQYLSEAREVDSKRVLWCFPHPSGANGHRAKQFALNKDALKSAMAEWFSS